VNLFKANIKSFILNMHGICFALLFLQNLQDK